MALPKRKQNRLKDYDYSQPGCYFITLCTRSKEHLFWENDGPIPVGAACGRPPLSKTGQTVKAEIGILAKTYSQVTVDQYVVMPNHVHIIIRIHPPENGRPQAAPTLPRMVNQFKGAVTKALGRPIWQKGYHDHIIRNEADYLRIWHYIDTNPAKWREDCYYCEGEKS